MPGFIHGELEQKILILYVLSRFSEPIPFDALLDLSLCDDGIDYFDFTERLTELTGTGHIACPEDKRYVITDKGRRTAEICETELPYTVRTRCAENAERYSRALLRQEQVRAEVEPRRNGTFTVRMILDDDIGNLMDLRLVAPDRDLAETLAQRFQSSPERTYTRLMNLLLEDEPDNVPSADGPQADNVTDPDGPEPGRAPVREPSPDPAALSGDVL